MTENLYFFFPFREKNGLMKIIYILKITDFFFFKWFNEILINGRLKNHSDLIYEWK